MISVIVQSMIMLCVIGLTEPMIQKCDNRYMFITECFVLLFGYHLLALTDFTPDLKIRDLTG